MIAQTAYALDGAPVQPGTTISFPTLTEAVLARVEFVTDARLRALREAAEAGDRATVRDCTAALAGDQGARLRCARVIGDAAARSG